MLRSHTFRRDLAFYFLLICLTATFFIPASQADVVVYDHFDGVTIDPAWTVTMERVTDWTYELASSQLLVTDIEFDSLHGDWSSVALSQEFDALSDFTVDALIGWDSDGMRSAMQNISVVLFDTTGTAVVYAIYHDAWDANFGRVTAMVNGTYYNGPNNLPLAGQAAIEIQRNGGSVTISWDGGVVLTETFDTPIDRLEVRFSVGAWPTATFGELSVDLISCEGTLHVPVRKTTWGLIKTLYH